jgi:hypothetical protein
LAKTSDTETQQTEASSGSDTLLHHLRALHLDKASERLELLGQEVGYDTHSDTYKPVSEVNGYILQAFRQCKSRFKKVSDHIHELKTRIDRAIEVLDPLPEDYPEPSHPMELLALQQNHGLIAESFDELDEKVDEIRSQLIQQVRKGQFSALRDVPERLLNPIQQQSNILGGKQQRIENTIRTYRNQKLEQTNGDLRPILDPLFTACGKPAIPALGISDVADLSLHDMNVQIDLHQENWRKQAAQLLAGTGFGLARWREIAEAILTGKPPALTPEEQQKLVARGILRVQVTFGGKA